MKWTLLVLLYVSTYALSFAQGALDSLRLTLPLGHTGYISEIKGNSGGDFLMTIGNDDNVFIWDQRTAKLLQHLSNKKIRFAVFDELDHHTLLTVNDQGLQAYDIKTLSIKKEFHFETDDFLDLYADPKTNRYFLVTERRIFVLSKDLERLDVIEWADDIQQSRYNALTNTLYLQNSKGIIVKNDRNNTNSVIVSDSLISFFDLSENGKYILTYGKKTSLKLWNAQTSEQLVKPFKTESRVHFAKFSANYLLCSTYDNTLHVYDTEKRKSIQSVESDALIIEAVVDSERKVLITSDKKNRIRFYNLNDGRMITQIEEVKSSVYHVAVLPQSPFYFVTTSREIYAINKVSIRSVHSIKNASLEPVQIDLRTEEALIFTSDGNVNGINFSSPGITREFYGHNGRIWDAEWTKQGDSFFTCSSDGLIRKWETSEKESIVTFTGHQNSVRSITLNGDQTKLISASNDGTVRIWNAQTGELQKSIVLNGKAVRSIEKHPGKDLFVAATWANSVYLIDGQGTIKDSVRNLPYDAEWAGFNAKGDLITVKLWNNHYRTFHFSEKDMAFNKPVLDQFLPDEALAIRFAGNKNRAVVITPDSVLRIYDLDTRKQIFTSNGVVKAIEPVQFSSGDHVAFQTPSGFLQVLDLKSGKISSALEEHSTNTNLIYFMNNDSILVTVEQDNGVHYWELADQLLTPKFTYYPLNDENWVIRLSNSPYYMCSKKASKMLHYVTPELDVIGFEQLDPVYNRPDIVMQRVGQIIGGVDDDMVHNYRVSWEKRIQRMGLDKERVGTGEIAVPNAEIVDADDIPYENKEGKLSINVKATDAKYTLRRFNVYVNEVPLYGSEGISIEQLKKQHWDTTLSVPLSLGENKVQVSVMNELGLENFKYPLYLNYNRPDVESRTYYIGIGVNEFKDERITDLKYCVKDVRDLGQQLASQGDADTLLLVNDQVTHATVLKLKEQLMRTTVNDRVIISCSSHGLLDDDRNFYLATYDMDPSDPELRGINYEELEWLLDSIPARKKLLLLDACNSGENDLDPTYNPVMTEVKLAQNGRGAEAENTTPHDASFNTMMELFVNVRNNTGSVIISAAGGQQSALEAIVVEGKMIENGAFTYCVLEFLKQHLKDPQHLTVNKLKQYVEDRVQEITNGDQQPTSRQETMEVDWGLR